MTVPAGAVMVRSFHGRGASGNVHMVFPNADDGWTPQRAIELSLHIAPTIVVLIHRHRNGEHAQYAFALSFFSNGYAIRRCGSGSLAAARVLLNSGVVDRSALTLSTSTGPVQIVCDGNQRLGYKIDPLPCFQTAATRCWQGVINRKISNVTLIGGDSDYCLLELRNQAGDGQSALQACRVNASRLSLISRRALIVTARSHDASHDYALRYFSPQYGQYEDSATGSAHAMAAAYWQRRLLRQCVRGVQLSAAGGEFTVQRHGLSQCVYGLADYCASHR